MYTPSDRQNKALKDQEAFIRRMIADNHRKSVREAVRAYNEALLMAKEAATYEKR